MQTLYYTTGNFIRHTGNVVDLTEYRRRALFLDACASMGVVVMTLTFTLRVLAL